jgi:hypothetical protein
MIEELGSRHIHMTMALGSPDISTFNVYRDVADRDAHEYTSTKTNELAILYAKSVKKHFEYKSADIEEIVEKVEKKFARKNSPFIAIYSGNLFKWMDSVPKNDAEFNNFKADAPYLAIFSGLYVTFGMFSRPIAKCDAMSIVDSAINGTPFRHEIEETRQHNFYEMTKAEIKDYISPFYWAIDSN